jgi:hypothetical protein
MTTTQLTLVDNERPPWYFIINEAKWPQGQTLTMDQITAVQGEATKNKLDIDIEVLEFVAYWQHRIANRKRTTFVLFPTLLNRIRSQGRYARRSSGKPGGSSSPNSGGRAGGFADPARYE